MDLFTSKKQIKVIGQAAGQYKITVAKDAKRLSGAEQSDRIQGNDTGTVTISGGIGEGGSDSFEIKGQVISKEGPIRIETKKVISNDYTTLVGGFVALVISLGLINAYS